MQLTERPMVGCSRQPTRGCRHAVRTDVVICIVRFACERLGENCRGAGHHQPLAIPPELSRRREVLIISPFAVLARRTGQDFG
jgi:hypothetical protein